MKMMKTTKMMKRKRNVATFLSRIKTLSNHRRFYDFLQTSQKERNKAPCLSVEPRDDDRAAHTPPHPTKASSQSKETESAKGKTIFLICCNFAKSCR
jgi:hypothetical protein